MNNSIFLLYIFSLLILLFLGSCSEENKTECVKHTVSACEEDSNKVNIRIFNESNYDYCSLVMNPGSRTKNFGSINSGKNTCYIAFDEAYDYGYIQLFINNKEFVIQPIDYLGE